MKKGVKQWILAVILAIVGMIYTFVPPQTIVSWGIGFLRHNDRVLFGILCLLVSIVLVFKSIRNK